MQEANNPLIQGIIGGKSSIMSMIGINNSSSEQDELWESQTNDKLIDMNKEALERDLQLLP